MQTASNTHQKRCFFTKTQLKKYSILDTSVISPAHLITDCSMEGTFIRFSFSNLTILFNIGPQTGNV